MKMVMMTCSNCKAYVSCMYCIIVYYYILAVVSRDCPLHTSTKEGDGVLSLAPHGSVVDQFYSVPKAGMYSQLDT